MTMNSGSSSLNGLGLTQWKAEGDFACEYSSINEIFLAKLLQGDGKELNWESTAMGAAGKTFYLRQGPPQKNAPPGWRPKSSGEPRICLTLDVTTFGQFKLQETLLDNDIRLHGLVRKIACDIMVYFTNPVKSELTRSQPEMMKTPAETNFGNLAFDEASIFGSHFGSWLVEEGNKNKGTSGKFKVAEMAQLVDEKMQQLPGNFIGVLQEVCHALKIDMPVDKYIPDGKFFRCTLEFKEFPLRVESDRHRNKKAGKQEAAAMMLDKLKAGYIEVQKERFKSAEHLTEFLQMNKLGQVTYEVRDNNGQWQVTASLEDSALIEIPELANLTLQATSVAKKKQEAKNNVDSELFTRIKSALSIQ